MRNILRKELKLSASPLSYFFILFGLMFFLPGYPVLCGAFFVTLGIFQGFQYAREANDIVFSALLPICKKDVVKGKYLFVCFIEACSLILMLFATLIRMTVLSNSEQRFLDYKAIAAIGDQFDAIIAKPTAIVDIGGGSIQLSLFDTGALVITQSLKLGVLRLHERILTIKPRTSQIE